MINLLPKYEKNRVKREYLVRLITVASALFSVFIVSATIPLVISYVSIYYNIGFINNISEELHKSDSFVEMNNLIKTTRETNRKIKILVDSMGKTSREDITGVFSSIFRISNSFRIGKNNPIRISQISYEQVQKKGSSATVATTQATTTGATVSESGLHKIIIRGFAKDRQDFLSFLRKLESEKNFTSVDSPVSNLVESSDISFYMTLVLKDNKVI